MNKLTLTTFVALLMLSISVEAQVKDQYQSDGLTTTVVKEDSANDMDILNSQFDLDDVGMHQVIRITTRQEDPTPESTVTVTPQEVTPMLQENFTKKTVDIEAIEAPNYTASTMETPALILEEEESTVFEQIKIAESEVVEEVITVAAPIQETKQQATSNSTRSTKSSGVSASKKRSTRTFKIFNKRFKKQKRKRVPRKKKRNSRCYRF